MHYQFNQTKNPTDVQELRLSQPEAASLLRQLADYLEGRPAHDLKVGPVTKHGTVVVVETTDVFS